MTTHIVTVILVIIGLIIISILQHSMYRAGYDAGYRIGYEKGYINRAKDVRTAWVAFSHDSNNMFISGVLESLRPTSKGIQYYKDLHKAH